MKGMKALEFKLWSKAKYFNDKEKINKVFKINKILVKLHKKISPTEGLQKKVWGGITKSK